jgi:purine nucleosidase
VAERIPLILDVDTGIDDALALLYACASEDADLVAATCVYGNVTVDQAVRNTLATLGFAGRTGVEVARGAEHPLVRDVEIFPIVHGDEGLGHVPVTEPPGEVSGRPAHRLIAEVPRERPGEVILVATGPMTNVALALAEEPELPTLLRGFVIMGGAFDCRGNVTPAAEANIWHDPDAAAALFRGFSSAPEDRLPVCIGLDVTTKVRMTDRHLDELCGCAPGSPLSDFIRAAMRFYIDFHVAVGELDGAAMHDPLAVAVALDPSLVTLRTTRVEVETEGAWTLGQTVTDLDDVRLSPWDIGWRPESNARVALAVEADAFTDRYNERLQRLVTTSAARS